MINVNISVTKTYDNNMAMQTTSRKEDVSLSKEFKKNLSNTTHKNVVIDQCHNKNLQLNGSITRGNIMFKIMLMLTTQVSK